MAIFAKPMLAGALIALISAVAASSSCGKLELPWGTYEATELSDGSICKFANVRFASPPVGELRFAAPKYPPEKGEPEAVEEPVCMQMEFSTCGQSSPILDKGCFPASAGQQTEDCLFLDLYVPKSLLTEDSEDIQAPVIVWLYGGAFVFGSKIQYPIDEMPFYNGQGIIEATEEPVIFVAGNYRLGAFGWLAGSYMEEHGQPNAGLLDQRAILQFVKDHIKLVKGDPDNVSVWGESAGASSILHHLAMPDNVNEPLFHRAILQSPAYQWLWNRTGVMNDTFTKYHKLVVDLEECEDGVEAMDCLREADTDSLQFANRALFGSIACQGIMPVGPSVDGNLIEDIATNVYQVGGKLAELDSIIVSHVDNEVDEERGLEKFSFIPYTVRVAPRSESAFQEFLSDFMPGDAYQTIRETITKKWPVGIFRDQVDRARGIVSQSCFYCNTRIVLDAYRQKGTKTYAMNYAYLDEVVGRNLATHGTDLLPLFTNARSNLTELYRCLSGDKIAGSGLSNYTVNRLGPGLRSYFVSHAISGDPNVYAQGDAATNTWLEARVDGFENAVVRVMTPRGGLLALSDPFMDNRAADLANTALKCNFWKQVAKDISDIYNDAVDVDGRLSLLPSEEPIDLDGEWEL